VTFAVIVALLIALFFIVPTINVYSQTPSDPLKPVGYLFITAYGIIVGLLGGASIAFIMQALFTKKGIMQRIFFVTLSIGSAILSTLLFINRFKVP